MRKILTVLLAVVFILIGTGKADAEKASSLREFAAALEAHTAKTDDSFTIPCDTSVMKALKQKSPIGKNNTLLSEFMSMAGCTGSCTYSWDSNSVHLSDVSYYAGWRISRLWQNGQPDLLSPRERQTLEAAQELVSGASGSGLEKERFIYDALCRRITYQPEDDSSNEKDCAIGALLNGLADCDGYADAMLLCCSLAGIPCRYMHGDSRKPALPGSPDGDHMWNLICIDGTWLMCDVTWGDQEETEYLYFNLGRRDAGESYVWCDETIFTNVADSAEFARHQTADQQPVIVRSEEDVYQAARAATLSGRRRLMLFCPEERLWQTDRDTFISMLSHGGFGTISYNETGRLFEVINQTIPDVFCFCDTETDILTAIDNYAESRTGSFTLFLSPAISHAMLSDSCARLRELFSRSRLENPGISLNFSEQSGSVSLDDVTYTDPVPVCSSREDIDSLLNQRLPDRPATLEFVLGNGYAPSDIGDLIGTTVYSHGASFFRYGNIGSRVTISDITYYDDFCLASSEDDVRKYLSRAKETQMKEVRIYCSSSLYESLMANQSGRFFTLLEEAGFSVRSISYSDAYGLLLSENLY